MHCIPCVTCWKCWKVEARRHFRCCNCYWYWLIVTVDAADVANSDEDVAMVMMVCRSGMTTSWRGMPVNMAECPSSVSLLRPSGRRMSFCTTGPSNKPSQILLSRNNFVIADIFNGLSQFAYLNCCYLNLTLTSLYIYF